MHNGTNHPRFGHSCNAAGTQQMLVAGGARDAALFAVETTGDVPPLAGAACDAGAGVELFDLTNLTWGTFFNLEAPAYRVPRRVVDVIGGT